ncbi:MAG: sugar phosphate isomerase/epimerase [Deltaproteobacteria bacterium]|nr:sugar phosphate isomerase/epimerase [Deltaproteobacteria bacterium]
MLYGAMNSPVRPLLEEIKAIGEMGFNFAEVTMDAPEAHYSIVDEQREEVLEMLGRFDLGLVCHLPTFVSTADLTESIRKASLEEMLFSLEVAAALQPLKVVLHPSYIRGLGQMVRNTAEDYALRSLDVIVEKAHDLGLCLCLENMFPEANWLVEPEEFVEILAKFPTLNLTLDTGHAHMRDLEGTRCLRFIDMFPNRIGHIHASDNFGREDSHLPLGTGSVDFQAITKSLRSIGYNDTVTLEVFSRDRDYLKISREKLKEMMANEEK